jgi:hypothetical protein
VVTLGGKFPFKVSSMCSCIIIVLSTTHDHFNGNWRRVGPSRLLPEAAKVCIQCTEPGKEKG